MQQHNFGREMVACAWARVPQCFRASAVGRRDQNNQMDAVLNAREERGFVGVACLRAPLDAMCRVQASERIVLVGRQAHTNVRRACLSTTSRGLVSQGRSQGRTLRKRAGACVLPKTGCCTYPICSAGSFITITCFIAACLLYRLSLRVKQPDA